MLTEALAIGDGPFGARGYSGLHTRRRPDGRVAQRHDTGAIGRPAAGMSGSAGPYAPVASAGSRSMKRRTEASSALVSNGLARTPSKTLLSGPS